MRWSRTRPCHHAGILEVGDGVRATLRGRRSMAGLLHPYPGDQSRLRNQSIAAVPVVPKPAS